MFWGHKYLCRLWHRYLGHVLVRLVPLQPRIQCQWHSPGHYARQADYVQIYGVHPGHAGSQYREDQVLGPVAQRFEYHEDSNSLTVPIRQTLNLYNANAALERTADDVTGNLIDITDLDR